MTIFLHCDGDHIGDCIELLLLDGKLEKAVELSEKIKKAMDTLRLTFEKKYDSVTHLFAGDDIIVSFKKNKVTSQEIRKIQDEFKSLCGVSLSVGSGVDVQEALSNLRRAKLSGRDQFIGAL